MMNFKLKLIVMSLLNGLILLLILCLGSQNLNDRKNINIMFGETAPLPTGFVIGISIIIGVISGSTGGAILTQPPKDE